MYLLLFSVDDGPVGPVELGDCFAGAGAVGTDQATECAVLFDQVVPAKICTIASGGFNADADCCIHVHTPCVDYHRLRFSSWHGCSVRHI